MTSKHYAWVLLAAGLASCGKTEAPPAATVPQESPGPAANAAVSGNIVKLADGSDLARVQNQQLIHPQFYLTPPETRSPLIFAQVRTDAETGAPVILRKAGSAWQVVPINEAVHQEWVYAAACKPRDEIWAVLDQAGDVHAWQLTLLRSTDDGLTWQFFAAVKKPANNAIYAGFALAKNGQGRISMHLEEDTDGHPHGYYHYRTIDGGKTWTGPTNEPNDVEEADPFSAADMLQDAIKTVEAVPQGQ